jgi:microcystin degradation protein MlrC
METNSFNPRLAECSTFTTWLEGEEIESMRGTSLELGGIFAFFDQKKEVRTIPGFFAQATTSGRIKDSDFFHMADMLFSSLRNAGSVDGVLLVQHGAMLSESIDDCEAYIVEQVRSIVGDQIPICSSFDLHAYMTRSLAQMLDGASGYQTYPHIDHFETGYRAASHLFDLIQNRVIPNPIYRHIPLIMSCENSNTINSPIVPAINKLQDLLAMEGVLSGSLYLTQPWLDVKELGCSICIYIADQMKTDFFTKKVDEILSDIWENRSSFYPPMLNIKEALEECETLEQPIILVDYGDVPNAGSTGDGTFVLKALLEEKLSFPSVVVVADKESTFQAVSVGVGNTAIFSIGGFGRTGEFNERIPVNAKVLMLNSEPFVHLGPAQKGNISKPGMRALLQSDNVFIILCERVTTSHDRNMLLTMGLNPASMGIISMRATHSFLSCYAGVMKSWLYVDTPGFSTRNLKSLPFLFCERPIYPLDEM